MHLYSSYEKNNYGEVFDGMGFILKPKLVVDVGLLEGFSSYHLKKHAKEIILCDVFAPVNWKHADKGDIESKFPGVEVKTLDFYRDAETFGDNTIDLLHIDVNNDGDTFRCFLAMWYRKLSPTGVALLEGGSEERDNWWWMTAFSRPKIAQALGEFAEAGLDYTVLEAFPSMTIVRR